MNNEFEIPRKRKAHLEHTIEKMLEATVKGILANKCSSQEYSYILKQYTLRIAAILEKMKFEYLKPVNTDTIN